MAALVQLENRREPQDIQRVLALLADWLRAQRMTACGVLSPSGSIRYHSQHGFRGNQSQQSVIGRRYRPY